MGITEIEKQVGKGKIDHLTKVTGANYKIVPESDKRDSVNFGRDDSVLFKQAMKDELDI